ncbi:hypothetical protein ABR737_00390 [Streptomyces sp. Edi2]|uniref:hypothetical protein n=1 Tax=Streptomyces sp. Edi2 TaxID=3162528 RepID=UPI00330657C3
MWTLRLAAAWACSASLLQRDGDWIAVVEGLLAGAVDAEHAAARFRRVPVERAAVAEELLTSTVGPVSGGWGSPCAVGPAVR